MTIDERLEKLTQTVEFISALHQSNEDHIVKLIEQGSHLTERMDTLTERMDTLTENMDTLAESTGTLAESMSTLTQQMDTLAVRTIQAMDAINRLARIADNHEQRIEDLEDQRPS